MGLTYCLFHRMKTLSDPVAVFLGVAAWICSFANYGVSTSQYLQISKILLCPPGVARYPGRANEEVRP